MRPTRLRLFILAGAVASAALSVGCGEVTGPLPVHSDVMRAREAWLQANVRTYSFEIEGEGSWFPKTGFYSVHVHDGAVVRAVAPNGDAAQNFGFTVDSLWNHLLTAHQQGLLNSATFYYSGVPAEVDTGYWPADQGRRFTVRAFALPDE